MMFLLTCDKKLTKSQLSPTHASTKRKITDELKHNAGWYKVCEGSPVEVQWAVGNTWYYLCLRICRGNVITAVCLLSKAKAEVLLET